MKYLRPNRDFRANWDDRSCKHDSKNRLCRARITRNCCVGLTDESRRAHNIWGKHTYQLNNCRHAKKRRISRQELWLSHRQHWQENFGALCVQVEDWGGALWVFHSTISSPRASNSIQFTGIILTDSFRRPRSGWQPFTGPCNFWNSMHGTLLWLSLSAPLNQRCLDYYYYYRKRHVIEEMPIYPRQWDMLSYVKFRGPYIRDDSFYL